MTQSSKNVNLDCELRFAHIDGHTDLDFIPGQNKVITTGIDCEVRIWSLDENEDVNDSFSVEDSSYSIVANRERYFVALATNCVKSFNLDEGEDETLVCRFSANATHLAFHPDGEFLVAGAADFSIKLLNVNDRTEKSFQGHNGPILSVAIDPLRKYVASSSCDGTVCVWSIDSKSVHYQWKNVFPVSNDFENSTTLCRIAWEPKFGELFAVPKPDSLDIFKRGQWDSPHKKIQRSELLNISIAAFSKDGDLIAASTTQSIVMIWKMSDIKADRNNPLAILYNIGSCITSLKFNPVNTFHLCSSDKSGALRIMKIQSKNLTLPTSTVPEETSKANPINGKNKGAISQEDLENIFAELDDDPQEFSFMAAEENKNLTDNLPTQKLDDDEVFVEKQTTKSHSQQNNQASVSPSSNLINDADRDDLDAEFDIGAIKSQYEPMIFGDELENGNETKKSSVSNRITTANELVIDGCKINGKDLLALLRMPRYTPPLRQASFQSGSTPAHYKHRYMVWNSVGIVYGYNTDEERSIDVEFHDVAFHHSIHLTNMFNYTMADLSTACLLLGSNGDDESDDELDRIKSRLFCLLFNTWDSIKEWQVDMPQNEFIDAIAAGQTFVAAVTSQRYLRVWTIGGIQTSIVSIDGPAVNISAYDRFLMLLYHSASQHQDQGQSISCIALKVDHKGKTRCHPIPTPVPVSLSPKSTVYWAGFTDEGTPCVVDSDGIIRLYKSHFGNGWFPICATKEHANGKSDNFFIIGLSEIQAQVRCIFCKAARYPDTIPKPTLTILPLQIPLCEMFTSKAKHEEECLRSRWMTSLLKKLSVDGYDVDQTLEESEKKIINSLIKLFALALGAERESLALEIASLMPNRNALEGAVRYAERQRHRSLAMKLVEMIEEKCVDDNGDDDDDDAENSDTELQELITRKNVDRLRQLISDPNGGNGETMVPLAKSDENNGTKDQKRFTALKPKNLKQTKISSEEHEEPQNDDSDEDEVEEGENILKLKPIEHNGVVDNGSCKNPFKVKNGKNNVLKKSVDTSRKRKQYEDSDSMDQDELVVEGTKVSKCDEQNSSESDNKAFVSYFESIRDELYEDNEDDIENEEDLVRLARERFDGLSEKERKQWNGKRSQRSKSKRVKQNTVTEQPPQQDTAPKVNKITNFFKRN